MPAAFRAVYAVAGARKWYSFGSGVPRSVTALSRFTTARSAPDRTGAIGPIAVAGSRSSAAVRPVKCTSPAKANVRSTGAGDGEAGGAAGADTDGDPDGDPDDGGADPPGA